jgi:serine/threonine protein phosphatase PrpC
MELTTRPIGSSIEWGFAARPLPGERRSGDHHVVRAFDGGTLLGVIDGLGHGDGAADVAATAGDILERHASDPLERLVTRCHEALHSSRGVVLAVARIPNVGPMHWLAVGDAEGILVATDGGDKGIRHLPQHRGIVGRNLPPLRVETFELSANDVVLMATDGISVDGLRRRLMRSTPQWLATDILATSARPNDDALVLVARYRGQA